MDAFGIRELTPQETTGLQISAEPYLAALSEQYADRGLAKCARDTAEQQKLREAETSTLAPDAYRLSSMTDAAVAGIYRRGKDTMSANDLLRYFGETRARAIRTSDFSCNTGMDACTGSATKIETTALSVVKHEKKIPSILSRAKALPATVGKHVKSSLPTWFDSTRADTSGERTRFPVSAFAAVLAVAMSLMLIVASSVLLTRAESNISRLQTEITDASAEVTKLRSDFEVQNNLLEIRRIAVEEYGMVGEEYLKTDYVALSSEDSVETFETEREEKISLSALLSAIGIGKGD